MQGPGHLPPNPRGLPVIGRSWPVSIPPALLLALLPAGCRVTHVVTADDHGQPQFGQLRIVYDVVEPSFAPAGEAPALDLAFAKSHPYRAALASYVAGRRDADFRHQLRLMISYPHPRGDAERGFVTLAVPGGEPGEWTGIAEQTLSRTEIDVLFVHLASGGVCDSETRPNGTTRIAVEVDGHRIEKPWTREPRLDRLAVETYDSAR